MRRPRHSTCSTKREANQDSGTVSGSESTLRTVSWAYALHEAATKAVSGSFRSAKSEGFAYPVVGRRHDFDGFRIEGRILNKVTEWHWQLPAFQAGVLPNSQSPTPAGRPSADDEINMGLIE